MQELAHGRGHVDSGQAGRLAARERALERPIPRRQPRLGISLDRHPGGLGLATGGAAPAIA
jgi:hypothetical protein